MSESAQPDEQRVARVGKWLRDNVTVAVYRVELNSNGSAAVTASDRELAARIIRFLVSDGWDANLKVETTS